MQERAARATGLQVSQHEPPNLISYLPGQKFEAHYDFLDPATPAFPAEIETVGQRVVTRLTYLNVDFAGAETHFPESGFRRNVGDCLIFKNVGSDRPPDLGTATLALRRHEGENGYHRNGCGIGFNR
jgi:prolyl 4-hydroxylase